MKLLDKELKQHLMLGTVIPAHPLALKEDRTIDEKRQRKLTRYYAASGAGGVAVGVHSTQFEIREPQHNLYETVLKWASEEIVSADLDRPYLKIAGICGDTAQAVSEATLAVNYGYDMGLLSMGGLKGWTEQEILSRVKEVAAVIPVFGFYLQPSVGGRIFSYDFWRQFAEIENVEAIKCASFNRYQTLDVMRAVCTSSRAEVIAMYTGNDDNIVADLLTNYRFNVEGKIVEKEFVGGLLGHWAVWTHKAVQLLEEVKHCKSRGTAADWARLLSKGVEITDVNAAMFDPAHLFHGCIPGMHTMLKNQDLLGSIHCLNPNEVLSEGQLEEIQRVYQDYPDLNDDLFVREFLKNDRG
ncbi:dihydrodipicolinate synthase/N-acetylneuraminate lyase [Algoriphagus sp. 4150]|uniref:dihydrodipicolinate synthase family protein n=1 Tax=Algoriphagus sp. 4150 TaxID=2817756 RepID=UPI0028583743|nr:dihydrodipicolinate synthase family protein [Algoriphagus sp. 4150]MDR7129699.1 dihydrodipicolinate synthase/N-acetylneuraminate lyase [Algoriphagus sp. 4150]